MEKFIRIGVYRVFRKLGIQREAIEPDAPILNNLLFDKQDWLCFMFLLETRFNVQFSSTQEQQMGTVEEVIQLVSLSQGN